MKALKGKRWDPKFEEELIRLWEEERVYSLKGKGKLFSIDTPPPYPRL
jgi:valyl-tRNA synthetase